MVTLAGLGLMLLYLMRGLLALLLASAALAYLMDPLVDRLEARGLKRETGIAALATGGGLALTLALLLFVPYVAGEFKQLSGNLHGYVEGLEEGIERRRDTAMSLLESPPTDPRAILDAARALLAPAERLSPDELLEGVAGEGDPAGGGAGDDPGELALDEQLDISGLTALLKDAAPNVGRWLTGALRSAFAGGMSFVLSVLNLTLVPIFTFYLLRDWDRLIGGVDALIPPRHRDRVRRLATEIDERLSSFVRGQSTVCVVLGVLYSIGLLISGIDMGIAVGMLSGLLFIVPYLGTIVGVVVATALALLKFGFTWNLVAVWVTFGGVQLLEGSLLTPYIVGDKVGLHPLVVMIALLVGGNLLGIWGMLVAIPITAAAQVLLAEWYREYQASRFFEGRSR